MNVELKVAIIRSGEKAYNLAHLIGMHPTKLSHIVCGAVSPTESEKQAIAKSVSAEVSDLFPSPTDPVPA